MYKMKELFDSTANGGDYALAYGRRLSEMLAALDPSAIQRVVDELESARVRGSTIFVIANGGSAAVASHIVNDLGPNSLVKGKEPFRVLSLADNGESVTAVANDAGYENIFSYQLQSLFRKGDIVLCLSVSGNSENVVRGAQYARENGGKAIGWYGFDGGRLAKACDFGIHIPATKDEYGPVEDVFGILGHMVATYLSLRLGRQLHH
jgi:D-sedoheptulose 7-phosphate isomerase